MMPVYCKVKPIKQAIADLIMGDISFPFQFPFPSNPAWITAQMFALSFSKDVKHDKYSHISSKDRMCYGQDQ